MNHIWWHACLLGQPLPLQWRVLRAVERLRSVPTGVDAMASQGRSLARPALSPVSSHRRRFTSSACVTAAARQATKAKPTAKTKPAAKAELAVRAGLTAKAARRPPPPSPPTKRPSPPKTAKAPKPEVVRALAYLPSESTSVTDTDILIAPPPPPAALDLATALFLQPPPRFLYSAPRFLHLPRNTHTPEICILGRSNVGKSTLLNALAGLESGGLAGRSHGARPGRPGLAITSPRAGCTKTLNAYGFGPPAPMSKADKADASLPKLLATRSARRAAAPREPPPAHRLILLDLPGYGFHSRAAWGDEITKVLQRRAALRGAVLLVDAATGPTDGDRQALALLRDAQVRTLVVLTKADKLLSAAAAAATVGMLAEMPRNRTKTKTDTEIGARAAGLATLHATCQQVWAALQSTERAGWESAWTAGAGWQPELVVTGAGDPKGGGFGVAGARLAIARLAGVLPEGVAAKGAKTPKMVPYEQIKWAATSTEATVDQTQEQQYIADQAEERDRRSKARNARGEKQGSDSAVAAEGSAQMMADTASMEDSDLPAPAPRASYGRKRLWRMRVGR
ncbi:GTP-binding protein [Niveomyces insectorum RCEF 264]|uniref:GTP-binding protein n=1 Tax=Niveomyces insectorum RCEF 264 TaxID=1081102 RepID=A0A167SS41_9HYPO|nr:GTP-binding protein [Niveomyces insectorum RCEF 264]